MTYARFHLVFVLPPLAALIFLTPIPLRSWEMVGTANIVIFAAILFASPWDNVAVAKGIWGFDRDKFSVRILRLPIEEYAFFVLHASLVIAFVNATLGRFAPTAPRGYPPVCLTDTRFLVAIAALLAVWVLTGWIAVPRALRQAPRFHYAIHLFYWFLPILIGQWLLAWPILAPRWGWIALATVVCGGWLTLADGFAVRAGIWHFDERQITGHKIAGVLPWEEAAFFVVVSLLVAQSYIMLLPNAMR